MASLKQIGGQGTVHELGVQTALGRTRDSTIVIQDPQVSQKHAQIRRTWEGKYLIMDLRSRNGTFVNDRRVREAILQDGDELVLGETRFHFESVSTGASLPSFEIAPRETQELPLSKSDRRDSVVVEDMGDVSTGDWLAVESQANFPAPDEVADDRVLLDNYERLRAAHTLLRSFSTEYDIRHLLGQVVDKSLEILSAERGVVLLLDPSTGRFTMRVTKRRVGSADPIKLSRDVVRQVISTRSGVIVGDPDTHQRFDKTPEALSVEIRLGMCVPLLYNEEVLGIVHVDSSQKLKLFSRKGLEILSSIASQAAVAVKNLLLRDQLDAVAAREQERLEGLFEHLPYGLVLLDNDDKISLTNPMGESLLICLTQSGVGDQLKDLGDRPLSEIRDKAVAPISLDLKGNLEVKKTVAVSSRQIEPGGALAGQTLLTLRDVTEEREQERRLARSERLALMGELASGVAHDFNNLLSVILSYAHFAQTQATDESVISDVNQIRLAAKRASALVRRLLAFSSRETLHAEVLDLNECIGALEKLLVGSLGRHIRLSTNLVPEIWRVKADPDGIERIIINLALNARDAMAEGGQLIIETTNLTIDRGIEAVGGEVLPGRYVSLSVADTGCGMSEEQIARVFEPFFTTKKGGTGLGLAAVSGIVTQAGGHLLAESRPHGGTRITVLFPISEEPLFPGRHSNVLPPVAPLTGTVLLAEDEEALRLSMERTLDQAGVRVVTGATAQSVLEQGEAILDEVDLLVTDVIMPDLSGPELASKLQQQRPDLPILFISGYMDDRDFQKITTQGAELLTKPFAPDEFLDRVCFLLGMSGVAV